MRRRHEFNDEELRKLAQLQCTDEELAGWFGCTRMTITRLKRIEKYRRIIDEGREEGKASLRRRMMAAAMNGSIPMMIFLAKNILGMKDVQGQEHSISKETLDALTDAERTARLDEIFNAARARAGGQVIDGTHEMVAIAGSADASVH